MTDCCANCALCVPIVEKLDYSKGGCEHTAMPGYICLCFENEGYACWMVGIDKETSLCECFTPRKQKDAASC